MQVDSYSRVGVGDNADSLGSYSRVGVGNNADRQQLRSRNGRPGQDRHRRILDHGLGMGEQAKGHAET